MPKPVSRIRELTPAEQRRFYDAFGEGLHKHAVRLRAQGRFDAANSFAEQAHQWENMQYIAHGDFPGMDSAWLDELIRMYAIPEEVHASTRE